jgi:hypothetical protein
MLGVLVFLLLPLATLAFRAYGPERGWREAAVLAALAWGALVMVLSEGLGFFGALRFGPVLACWSAALLGVGALALRGGGRPRWPPWPADLTWLERVLAGALALLLAVSLVTAWVSPPNTPDTLSYHLPRQLMWLQQGGLAHFVTVDDRALMMPPLAELIQAHAMLLAGADAWANLPQWLMYGLGMVVASLLAREVGGRRLAQWLAAFTFGVLPMAWHQASSAKNDLMVAVWCAMFCWQALRLVRGERRSNAEWLAAGTALGLALATKTTAVIFVLPVLALLAGALWRNRIGAGLLVVTVLVLNAPHWSRNLAWYGTPLGVHRAEDGGAQGNEIFTGRAVASNALRNATLHLVTPWPRANAWMESAVGGVHRRMGQDVNDPKTTLWIMRYALNWAPESEPVVGAPAHFILGLAAAVWLLFQVSWRGAAFQALLLAAGGAVLYCVLVKWQPWGARLQLPAFIILAALLALVADRLGKAGPWVAAALVGLAWLPSLETNLRPLWTSPTILQTTRWENYFRNDPSEQSHTEIFLSAIRRAKIESLQVVTHHGYPYPLMRRYLDEGGPRARLWGSLPEAATVPPEGVLILKTSWRSMPLYVRGPNTQERFRAVGPTGPYGFYLPESRARGQAAEFPLPRFVGYGDSLGFGPVELQRHHGADLLVHPMVKPEAQCVFTREGPSVTLRLEAINPSAVACELEVRLNGRRVGRVRFEPTPDTQSVAMPLNAPEGRSELTLVSVGGAAPPLVFTTLQILDE